MRRAVLVVALMAWLAAPAAAAVDNFIGRTIASVRLEIDGRETNDPQIAEVVATQVGHPLSMAEARESITHLFSLGRFEDVQLHAEAAGAGVALRYALVPIHHVARMAFRGKLDAPGIDEGALRQAVTDRFGVSPALGRGAEVAAVIADTLRQRGYLHATVTPGSDLERGGGGRAILVFTIDPGARTTVGTVDVVGTPSVPVRELLDRLKLATGRPYEREALDQRIDRYVESRRAHGFYESHVMAAVALTDADRIANVTLSVTPGPRVRVVFAGDALPPERREDLVPVEREGSVDEDLLEDSSHRIEDSLRAEGYRDARAPYTREQRDTDVVITFTVHRGPQYRVETVEVSGNASVPLATIAPLLHVREHQPFAAANLDADVAAVEALYRRQGFTAARVQAAVEPQQVVPNAAVVPVAVRYTIGEGVQTVVASIRIEGNAAVDAATLARGLELQAGRPFFGPQMAADRDAIQAHYADLGYQSTTVEANPGLSADGSQANVVYSVQEGARTFVDHILIVGNTRTSSATIERELQIRPGDAMGVSAINDSQRRLRALGLFRSVRITELRHGRENRRDLLVTVEEAPATTLAWGGGVEVKSLIVNPASPTGVASQELDFAPRASFNVGRRNLFGKNRSVDLFSSVSVHTRNSSALDQGRLAEYRLIGTFREPRVFGSGADAFVTGTLEQQLRSSFNFIRRAATAEAGRRLGHGLSVSGSYQLQKITVFDEQVSEQDRLLVDRIFPQVLLSMFSASAIHDARDDAVDPSRGTYGSITGQLAARRLGSEVGFVKTFLTAQLFRSLPVRRRVVFAASARVGLATGFPQAVDGTEIRELPASERFFAGGDTTVRGFALDQLGALDTIKDGVPNGGNGLVILNGELRATVHGGFGVVGFVDTGNVFARVPDLNLGELRSAVGFGIRYKSPVGPIRVDLGFKLHRRDLVPGHREALTALHISFGQAF